MVASAKIKPLKYRVFTRNDLAAIPQLQRLAPDVRLSIMITESEIQDLQITPNGPVVDYTHRHVLRDMLTNYDGDRITETLSAGAIIEKDFSFTMPAGWKEENCEIVAFVSLEGASKDVLQAHQVHVIE